MSSQLEGSGEEVSELFLAAMIVPIPFQIPDLGLAMAEEETPRKEAPGGRRPTKGTKRRREGSGVPATEDDPLAQEVVTIDSGDEDPRHHQVSSFWKFLPAAS